MSINRPRPVIWPWVALALVVTLPILLTCLALIGTLIGGETAKPHVGLIELSGPISDGGTKSGILGGTSGSARGFISEVEAAARDKKIKAVVIRINSPGGAAAASQEMYNAVRRLQAVKPVICSMGDAAASGGYYTASGCTKIFADGATTTGSIGVIIEFPNAAGLFQKYGVSLETVKSGKFKDIGNPGRPVDPAERALIQASIMDTYNQFVDDVVTGRKAATKGFLTREKVLQLADGRIYTGRQAKSNGLVDELGGLREAIEEAGKEGGLGPEPKVSHVGSGGGLLDSLDLDSQSSLDHFAAELGRGIGQGYAAAMTDKLTTQDAAKLQLQAR